MKRWYALPAILVAAILNVLVVLWLVPDPRARIQSSLVFIAAWTLIYVGIWIFLTFVVVERDYDEREELRTMYVYYPNPKLLTSVRRETVETSYEVIREEETR